MDARLRRAAASVPRGARAVGIAVLAALGPAGAVPSGAGDEDRSAAPGLTRAPSADHHLHVRSEAGTEALLEAMETLEGRSLEGLQSSTGADDVLIRMDRVGIQQGVLLSLGYLFGVPEVDFEDERSRVRAENEYVAAEAGRHPDRLVAFCGLNPLAEYALDEVERCARDGRVAGIKLHLANSDVDLRDPGDVEALARVVSEAARHDLALVIHLFTRHPDYGYRDAAVFIEEVLPEAEGVPVQVAHLAGPGPFGEATEAASRAFADALAGAKGAPPVEESALADLYFDTAEVLIPPEMAADDEEVAEAIREANQAAAARMTELGAHRIVYGSDWIMAHDPPRYAEVVEGLPLPDDLLRSLAETRAPYLP